MPGTGRYGALWMMAGMDKAKGTREQLKGKDSSGGNIVAPPEDEAPTLTEIGITKKLAGDGGKTDE